MRSKIAAFASLAPVAYLGTVHSPIRFIAPICKTVTRARYFFGRGRFMPSNVLIRFLGIFLCKEHSYPFICENVIFLLAGFSARNTNTVS